MQHLLVLHDSLTLKSYFLWFSSTCRFAPDLLHSNMVTFDLSSFPLFFTNLHIVLFSRFNLNDSKSFTFLNPFLWVSMCSWCTSFRWSISFDHNFVSQSKQSTFNVLSFLLWSLRLWRFKYFFSLKLALHSSRLNSFTFVCWSFNRKK